MTDREGPHGPSPREGVKYSVWIFKPEEHPKVRKV